MEERLQADIRMLKRYGVRGLISLGYDAVVERLVAAGEIDKRLLPENWRQDAREAN